ncbi:MAG: hypothetical protein KJS97_02190 [Alphaproteobacteria bacterium]|nr:hypothetical protein [Alphaproteobacteria bacterium]
MSSAVISDVRLGAAHDGEAELVVTLRFENGGQSVVALDHAAASVLMESCRAQDPAALIGQGWEHVRDALAAAAQRFMTAPPA